MLPQPIIQETIDRYQQHRESRDSNLDKLAKGSVLSVDSPERVNRRLERISRSSVAGAIGTEVVFDGSQSSADEFAQIVQERQIGQNDLMSVSYLEFALQVSRSICRIIIRGSNGRVAGYGTGFLVSPHLIMTNNHVLTSLESANKSLAEFNFEKNKTGQIKQSLTYELDPISLFITNRDLDYTLVAVKEKSNLPPLKDLGWNALIEEEGKVIIGEYVNIIQHPNGEPKQLALRENQLIDLLDNFLHYRTDTAPGSSGSPVFNDQWEVVGIHHSGVPRMDKNGNFIATDGSLWDSSKGEDKIDWLANEGVRISRIIKDIKGQGNLQPKARKLRSEIFDLLDSNESSPIIIETKPPDMTKSADNSFTWTIPLKISVSLDMPNLSSPVTDKIPDVSIVDTDLEPEDQFKPDLELLEKARRGEIPYYNERADEKERKKYYANLPQDFDSLGRERKFSLLSALLKKTHKPLNYKPSTHLYPWVDLQESLKIRSVYSNLLFEPEAIIREDLLIEQMRSTRLQETLLRESLSSVQVQEQIDLLEKSLPFNCEHVVPQSWFGKAEPMRGDLHHLFGCEPNCNSFRSNFPFTDFADFPDTKEKIRSLCGKLEDAQFEPGNGKGEVARATLYFLLRYPGFINNNQREYTPSDLDTLLTWHRDHPVTIHEKHRNAAIQVKQGNRNPLIDFPSWAEKIEFKLGID
jgi:endonuclease I/V8-like Glu-specific endopeptidase